MSDNEHESSSNATRPHHNPDGKRDNFDSYEFQVAMDQLTANGSTELLKHFLARQEGLDPNEVVLRSTPWSIKENEPSEIRYLGQADSVAFGKDDVVSEANSVAYRRLITSIETHNDANKSQEVPDILEYTPLDSMKKEIRLLHFSPDAEEISLDVIPLDEAKEYQTLSYVWGKPERVLSLPVNKRKVMVTRNLYGSIIRCMLKFPHTPIWCDGICINQDDYHERAQQVALMGEIYSKAVRVVAVPGHFQFRGIDGAMPAEEEEYNVEESNKSDGMTTPPLIINPTEERHFKQDVNEISGSTEMISKSIDEETSDGRKQGEEDATKMEPHKRAVNIPSIERIDEGQKAFSLMNYLSRIWNSDPDFATRQPSDWDKYEALGPGYDNNKIWATLMMFWNEDWFTRAWILQEAVLAKNAIVIYHDSASNLDSITRFWDLAQRKDPPKVLRVGPLADVYNKFLNLSSMRAIKTLRDLREQLQKEQMTDGDTSSADIEQQGISVKLEMSLLSLLRISRSNQATDPRDKVYCLLGLASDDVARSITPDYSPQNTTAKLYTEVAKKYINQGAGTELLHYAGADRRLQELPSWVPDWSHLSRSAFKHTLYNCLPGSMPSITTTDNPGKITVRGAIIDAIQIPSAGWRYYSHDSRQHPFNLSSWKETLQNLPRISDEEGRQFIHAIAAGVAISQCTTDMYPEGPLVALSRTLTADCTWKGSRTSDDSSFFESFQAYWSVYAPQENPPQDVSVEEWAKKYRYGGEFLGWLQPYSDEELEHFAKLSWPYESAMQAVQKGRKFCATLNNYLCTATHDTERGDLVAILEGFSMPFILRERGEEFEVVGDCYVHGIMDGELACWADGLELDDEYLFEREDGREYAVKLKEGFAKFEDIVLI
jgi:hypothetical protein